MKDTEPAFLTHLLQTVPLPEPVLEVGAGWRPDFHQRPFRERGYTRLLTHDAVAYPECPPPDICCDVCDLAPVASSSIGTVLCFNVLEHCPAPARAVAELHRILNTSGWLIGSVPGRCAIHRPPRDYWRFRPEGIAELVGAFRLH